MTNKPHTFDLYEMGLLETFLFRVLHKYPSYVSDHLRKYHDVK